MEESVDEVPEKDDEVQEEVAQTTVEEELADDIDDEDFDLEDDDAEADEEADAEVAAIVSDTGDAVTRMKWKKKPTSRSFGCTDGRARDICSAHVQRTRCGWKRFNFP